MKWEPFLWLGASSEGGFSVPSAKATPFSMYGPRGVFYDGKRLVVADTGNHRVLIWFSLPERDHQPADIVLGQKSFYEDSPNAGGDKERGMYMPCGVWIYKDMLFVADSWNHRILVWEEFPEENFKKPDSVIGQENLHETEPNKGEDSSEDAFFWCYGMGVFDDLFVVCDTGNRRVLLWEEIPEGRKKADAVIKGLMWPHSVSKKEDLLIVADAGSHKVVGFNEDKNFEPSLILGQKSFHETVDWSMYPQNERTLRFPYGVSCFKNTLAVADTANNRVLIWEEFPEKGTFVPANLVIGQDNFTDNGENKLKGVFKDTLCWPYGVHLFHDLLFIADTGNNRVVVWENTGGDERI